MTTCDVTPRKWGNSVGIILPKELVDAEGIELDKPNTLLIVKPGRIPKEMFGMIKRPKGKSTQQILDEMDKELYDD
ncbi:MAG: AbrB/MazE/SpoVT family DNA-binding domain-containing protein [Candidatus Woesearchaeota archaeon]